MYERFDWSTLESAPGTFNFQPIDGALAAAQAAGQRLAFRVMGYEDGDGGPVGLRNAGFPGFSFTFDGATSVWWPDLDQPVVQADLAQLIAALGQRYGAHPGIDSVDVGIVGDWGEQHFWATSPTPPFPSTATLEWLGRQFNASFQVPVIIGGDLWNSNLAAFNADIQSGMGWRVDCWGDWAAGWNQMTNRYPYIVADVPNAWQKAPVIMEPCGTMASWVAAGYPWQQTLQWAVDNHVSELSNKSDLVPGVMTAAVTDMLTKLGYRFVVTQAQLPTQATAGAPLALTISWANRGNAPMYFDRHVVVRVGGRMTDTGLSMKGFLPGARVDQASVSTPGLAAGRYDVALGLAPPGGAPDIRLAIQGAGPWYSLGTVTLN
jgi:hypothetical protein